ncbi:MAG: hypothetical protein JWP18_1635, partial [Solirubrobacterales bacterium]|nr:hypothetical protein [Solirubrobacterales bacterium]
MNMGARLTPPLSVRALAAVGLVGALALLTVLIGAAAPAFGAPTGSPAARSKAAWGHETGTAARKRPGKQALVAPRRYAAFRLDPTALEDVLAQAPRERTKAARTTALVVSVPTPDGGFERFAIAESPVLAPALAAAHPEIRTYAGRGVDEPTATIRLDFTPLGFHGSVRDPHGSWFVDPRYRDQTQYVAYERSAVSTDPAEAFVEGDGMVGTLPPMSPSARAGEAPGEAVKLRTYRLALASDPTYAVAVGGLVTAAKTTLLNRVNQLYEADLAIRLQLIAGNDALNLDTDAEAIDPNGPCGADACFTAAQLASCSEPTLARMDVVAGLLAGARNFDIGHLVMGPASGGNGGVANVGVVGDAMKAGGCTALANPVGDAFAVDYVAHEMGHQFGGGHTFNGTHVNCAGTNRASETSVEPGSGTTVMAYAGICGSDDLQAHSDPYFSAASIAELSDYVRSADPPESPTLLSSQQMGALTHFNANEAFRFTYGGQESPAVTRNSTFTEAGMKAAIQGIPDWPVGATVKVSGVSDSGFVVTFDGTLAGASPQLLGLTGFTGNASGFIGETRAGGPTTQGGTAVTGPNHAPAVTTAPTFAIPARTPFTLTASGSDADADALTYLWEQNDPGSAIGLGLVANTKTTGPLFRVFGTAARYADPDDTYLSPSPGENLATGDPTRTFPDLPQILAGNTNAATGACPAAAATPTDEQIDCFSEFLPTSDWVGTGNRTLHFRVTARDNRLTDGGGVSSADTALTVAPLAGPFRVTSQATPQTIASSTPLT